MGVLRGALITDHVGVSLISIIVACFHEDSFLGVYTVVTTQYEVFKLQILLLHSNMWVARG